MHVVLDHQHRDAHLLLDVLDPEGDVLRLLRRQARGRFVEQEQLRLDRQRAAHLDDLAHAVRQAGNVLLAIGLQVEELDHAFDRLPVAMLFGPHRRQEQKLRHEIAPAMAVAPDEQVLQHGRLVEQLDVLEGARDAERGDLVRRARQDALALEAYVAFGRVVEPRDQVEDRRLAGPVRPDQREDLALLDGERNLVDRHDAAEAQGDVVDLEQAHRMRSVLR